jgi:NADH:ubiquinone oxidoreductase subunit 2 (subunit N)
VETRVQGNRLLKTVLFILGFTVAFYPSIAFATTPEESYEYMNTILTVAITLGGFLVVFSIIASAIKLASSQNNPQNRTAGIIGLVFSLLGGYMVYKALDIAGWISSSFGL